MNHLISSPYASITWAAGSVRRPAEVNEKIPPALPDPPITNWMDGWALCLAQPDCGVSLQAGGSAATPPLLALRYSSRGPVLNQTSPMIELITDLAKKIQEKHAGRW